MDQILMTTVVVTSTTKICTQFKYIVPLKLFNKKLSSIQFSCQSLQTL